MTSRSVVVGLAVIGLLAALATIAQRYGFSGLALDRGAADSWLNGTGLYAYRAGGSHLGTALPPAAAVLVVPAALLPLSTAGWLLALAGAAALGLALIVVAGPIARRYGRRRWPVVLAAGALALTAEPVRAALGLGTLDLLAFGLITADIVALRRLAWAKSRARWWPRPTGSLSWPRRFWTNGGWAGAGVGLAAALTVSPLLFVGYFAITKQWRAALTAVTTATVTATTAALIAPHETAAWFGDVLWRIDRAGPVDATANQSLAGVLARLYDSATTPVLLWFSFSLLLVAVGLVRARSAHADGDEIAAFTLVGLSAAIAGPVTNTHELVWLLPTVLVLVDAGARRRETARRSLPGRPRQPGAGLFAAAVAVYGLAVLAPMGSFTDPVSRNSYALALILLVNALPWRPGAAPAVPVDRWAGRRASRRAMIIPPPREPLVRGS
ncbi:glycosyltransferase 87 family protein [Actinoplanes sp. NPDC051859]|uniref:glycosyltransferase 87 family protein n=1 Tax=Actinoplanes sp. NPDC051859 TaxID=3363909 RepID=UPI00379BA99E